MTEQNAMFEGPADEPQKRRQQVDFPKLDLPADVVELARLNLPDKVAVVRLMPENWRPERSTLIAVCKAIRDEVVIPTDIITKVEVAARKIIASNAYPRLKERAREALDAIARHRAAILPKGGDA